MSQYTNTLKLCSGGVCMKKLNPLFFIMFIVFSFLLQAQDKQEKILVKDSLCLDSVAIVHEVVLEKVKKFYNKNENLIDSNSFLFVLVIPRSKVGNESYSLSVYLSTDIENELQSVKENVSSYFMVNNTIALVPFSTDSNKIFKRANVKKQFCFNKRETVYIGLGASKRAIGYEITFSDNSDIKIRKNFHQRYPSSKIKRWIQKLRFWR